MLKIRTECINLNRHNSSFEVLRTIFRAARMSCRQVQRETPLADARVEDACGIGYAGAPGCRHRNGVLEDCGRGAGRSVFQDADCLLSGEWLPERIVEIAARELPSETLRGNCCAQVGAIFDTRSAKI